MTLKELETGKSAVIRTVGGKGALRQHFLDMGMIPGAEVTVVKLAPMGDPMELQVHGYELTLRLAEADQIEIAPIDQRTRSHAGSERLQATEHPGLGEEGKYHSKEDENPLPEGTMLTYALVGSRVKNVKAALTEYFGNCLTVAMIEKEISPYIGSGKRRLIIEEK